jgi:chorismate mutase
MIVAFIAALHVGKKTLHPGALLPAMVARKRQGPHWRALSLAWFAQPYPVIRGLSACIVVMVMVPRPPG